MPWIQVPPSSPYHDFAMRPVRAVPRFAECGASWFYAMGQDWWQADDYKAFATNMAKMKDNFIATHTYATELAVWIGTADQLAPTGAIKPGTTVSNTTSGRQHSVQLMSLVYFKQLVEAEAAATAVGLVGSKIAAPNVTAAAKKKLALCR